MNNRIYMKLTVLILFLVFVFISIAVAQNDLLQIFEGQSDTSKADATLSVEKITFSFLLAGILGAIVSYRKKIDAYGLAVMEAHIILAFAASLMMMIIGSEIARAFGLMGAATIVRYRYSLSSPREASSLIIALGVGMACGVGLYALAIIATIFVRIGFNIFNFLPNAVMNWIFDFKHHYNLKISIPTVSTPVMMEDIDELFSKENLSYKLISAKEKKSASEQTVLTYEIVLDNLELKETIYQKLRELKYEVFDVIWIEKKADRIRDYFSVKSIGD